MGEAKRRAAAAGVMEEIRGTKVGPERLRRFRAYHEASHAVIARALGIEVISISMSVPMPNGKDAACVMVHPAAHYARNADLQTRIAAFEKDAKQAYAGLAAEHEADPHLAQMHMNDMRTDLDSDLQDLFAYAEKIALLEARKALPSPALGETTGLSEGDEDEATYAVLERLQVETITLVKKYWPTIDRVAKVLINQDFLHADELNRILASPD